MELENDPSDCYVEKELQGWDWAREKLERQVQRQEMMGFFVALQVLDHTADISFVSWFRVCGLCTCLPEQTVADEGNGLCILFCLSHAYLAQQFLK